MILNIPNPKRRKAMIFLLKRLGYTVSEVGNYLGFYKSRPMSRKKLKGVEQ